MSNSANIDLVKSETTPWEEIEKADIIVIPSRIESFGLVAIEAGAMGKCVLASNTGGLKEIIISGENGLLFESENVEDLYNKLIYLYKNSKLIKSFGEELRRDVEKKFTVKVMQKKYLKIYSDIVQ